MFPVHNDMIDSLVKRCILAKGDERGFEGFEELFPIDAIYAHTPEIVFNFIVFCNNTHTEAITSHYNV